jgi:excisionase family DNA binding protein
LSRIAATNRIQRKTIGHKHNGPEGETMALSPDRKWVNYQEASEISGLSRTTLWKLISTGEIRAAKVGKAVRISRRSLEQYLNEQDYAESVRS